MHGMIDNEPLRDEIGEMMHQANVERERELVDALVRCARSGSLMLDLQVIAAGLGLSREFARALDSN